MEKAAAKAQLKLDRAAEKERIKAEAKKNREEMKNAPKTVGGNNEGQGTSGMPVPSVRQPDAVGEVSRTSYLRRSRDCRGSSNQPPRT